LNEGDKDTNKQERREQSKNPYTTGRNAKRENRYWREGEERGRERNEEKY
jgi:hypothetical protein